MKQIIVALMVMLWVVIQSCTKSSAPTPPITGPGSGSATPTPVTANSPTPTSTGTLAPTPSSSVTPTSSGNWTRSTANAAFGVRAFQSSVTFNNKMWIIGGAEINAGVTYFYNDVWNSSDGTNWSLVTPSAAFSPRGLHSSFVFNNTMWIIGGYNDTNGYLGEIWSSTDGVNWAMASNSAQPAYRIFFSTLVFNNAVWLFGGSFGCYGQNDVWESLDGVNWAVVNPNAPFGPRCAYSAAVFNNQMWLIGGYNQNTFAGQAFNDVWSSSNGINWTQATSNAGFAARGLQTSLAYNNELWVIGGTTNISGSVLNDTWHSSNGISWSQNISGTFSPARAAHSSLVFNNSMWILGGWGYPSFVNDIWHNP